MIRIIRTRLLQIALTRLTALSQTGRISSLLTKEFDPVLLQIEVDGEVKGCCSVRKSIGGVLTIEAFGLVADSQIQIQSAALLSLVRYAKRVGSSRIVTSTCSGEFSRFLHSYGFATLYFDDVLFVELSTGLDIIETTSSKVQLRKPNLRRLPIIYAAHLNVFSNSPLEEVYDPTAGRSKSMNVSRALGAWIVHVLIARLGASIRLNTIVPLFRREWDPIPLEIHYGGSLVGYCFLLKITPPVVELGIIGILNHKQRAGLGSLAVDSIKQFTREIGVRRLVTGSGFRGTGPFFRKCGFELAFSEETMCLQLDKA